MIPPRIMMALSFATVMLLMSFSTLGAPPPHANGQGNPPVKVYWEDFFGGPTTVTFPFISCGDFETLLTQTLSGFWVFHPTNSGRDEWEFYHTRRPTTITNADDTSMFVEGVPGQVINRHWTGTPFASDVIETGAQILVTLPGHGVIYRDVGRIRLDISTFPATVEFIAGHWDSYDEDFEALCASLTP